jgi:hypothetical protein
MSPHPKPFVTSLFLYISILTVTLIVFDVASYWFLPNRLAASFKGYRERTGQTRPDVVGGDGSDEHAYFISHPTRGFDIKPGARGTQRVDGSRYPIWGNSLGCFDHEWNPVPHHYFYFAGDSSTWAFTPYSEKFGTLFERRTGIPSLKCGVTHTGQLHQFGKFKDIVTVIKQFPEHVIVGYSYNDISDDYAHPQSTVIDGWLVDNVFLEPKSYGRVTVREEWLRQQITAKLSRRAVSKPRRSFVTRAKQTIKAYSISAQLLARLRHILQAAYSANTVALSPPEDETQYDYAGRSLIKVFALDALQMSNGKLRYADTKITHANREALLAWKQDAILNHYKLTVLLMPYSTLHQQVGVYSDVAAFLQRNGIDYIDLLAEVQARKVSAEEMYWVGDEHMSPMGNRLVAEILVHRFGRQGASEER